MAPSYAIGQKLSGDLSFDPFDMVGLNPLNCSPEQFRERALELLNKFRDNKVCHNRQLAEVLSSLVMQQAALYELLVAWVDRWVEKEGDWKSITFFWSKHSVSTWNPRELLRGSRGQFATAMISQPDVLFWGGADLPEGHEAWWRGYVLPDRSCTPVV
jgi:hypothetical protein